MKIKTPNRWREKLTTKLLGLVYRLDNSGNAVFEQNGEKNFIDQISADYPGSFTVFDVGANLGKYTGLILDTRAGGTKDEFHLFEPQKSCFARLTEKFAGRPNVFLNNFGLSDRAGEFTIYKDAEESGLTSLYRRNLDFYGLELSTEENVALNRADDYIAGHGLAKINLVKIDIEGHEISALRGFGKYLNSDFIDFIQFEYGGANLDSRTNLLDFYNLLEPAGFLICKMMPRGMERRPYHPRLDNFVNQNFVAISRNICDNLGKYA